MRQIGADGFTGKVEFVIFLIDKNSRKSGMKLTKEKYFSICEESGFVGAKYNQEVNKNNFYLPIEVAPCFLAQPTALAFSWCNDKCYSHFQYDDWHSRRISYVKELQNEIERCKELYEQTRKAVMKKMVAVKKNEIRKASEGYEA